MDSPPVASLRDAGEAQAARAPYCASLVWC